MRVIACAPGATGRATVALDDAARTAVGGGRLSPPFFEFPCPFTVPGAKAVPGFIDDVTGKGQRQIIGPIGNRK